MWWIVCAIISLAMLVLAGFLFFNKKIGSLRMVFVTISLFLATYTIYLPATLSEQPDVAGVLGNFVYSIQVMAIDANFFDFYEIIKLGTNSAFFEVVYTVIRTSLHVLMPIALAMTAVTVLFKCFASIRVYFANKSKKPMFIFSERNEMSLQLAKTLKGLKCHVIFAGVEESSITDSDEESNAYVLKEERICNLKTSGIKDKEVYYFCISKDEDRALSETLGLIDKLSKLKESDQEKTHIYLFSKFNDFSIYLDSAEKGSLNVYCINEYETQIYQLLDQYPLFDVKSSKIHVLLHGLSEINKVALKAISWCGQLDGFSMKISIVGVGISDAVDELKLKVPNLFTDGFDIKAYNCSNEKEVLDSISQYCADANYIIVSEATDNDTMEKGILLRRLFYNLDKEFKNCPQIFCYVNDIFKYDLLKNLATAESNPKRKMSYNIIPFGRIDEVYSYKNLVDSPLEKIAKNVHMAYEEIFSGPLEGENVKEALKRYSLFEVNKRSNRANALHIRYKLRLLGLDYVEGDGQGEVLRDYFTEESLERLSISEHDRWMSFLESEGWTQSSREDVYAYKKSDISKGRHNCPILKKHPYICEYEKLKDLSLELEGKDTTRYDRELIERIPEILDDHWNISGKKYKIIKIK